MSKGGKTETSTDTSAFYLELSKLEKSRDFDKALKICNKILNVTPKDDTAFHCKMVRNKSRNLLSQLQN